MSNWNARNSCSCERCEPWAFYLKNYVFLTNVVRYNETTAQKVPWKVINIWRKITLAFTMILDDCCLRFLLQRLSSIDLSFNNVYLSPDVSTGENDLFALGNGNTYNNVYLALETRLMLKTIHDVSLGNRKINLKLFRHRCSTFIEKKPRIC